jgi:hypothetical protein
MYTFFVKAFGMNSLSAFKGSKVVTVVVFLMSQPEPRQKDFAVKLARVALGKFQTGHTQRDAGDRLGLARHR